jgi:8-oxo-dGTP pyrophosphatase MutT (NUDIX family)
MQSLEALRRELREECRSVLEVVIWSRRRYTGEPHHPPRGAGLPRLVVVAVQAKPDDREAAIFRATG